MKYILSLIFLMFSSGCFDRGSSSVDSNYVHIEQSTQLLTVRSPQGNVQQNSASGIVDLLINGDCEIDESFKLYLNSAYIQDVPCVNNTFTTTLLSSDISVGEHAVRFEYAGNEEASFSLFADITNPTITITAPSRINSTNESSYSLGGSCSIDGDLISGDINGISFSATCATSAWSVSNIDTALLGDGTHAVNYFIEDLAGNTQLGSSSVVKKAVASSVQSIVAPVDGAYSVGSSLDFQLTFNSNIVVTNNPCISLNVGGVVRDACYASGSGGNSITFSYIVQAGETDNDGIVLSSPIDLKTGSIKDTDTNDADLIFSGVIPALTGVTVNTSITGPDAVSSVNQTNLSLDRTQVSFEWTAPNDNGTAITKYIVRYKEESETEYTYLSPDPILTNTTITGLETEKIYDIQVAAFNGVIGAYSSILKVSTVFNPASLGALIWYESKDINGDGSSVADGTSISTLTDKSGNGNNATKISGTDATIETENGHKVLRMGAAGYRTISSLGEAANTDIEVYIIAKTRVISTSFAFVNENEGNANRFGTHFPWSNSNAYIDLPMGERINGGWGGNTTDFFAWTFRSSTTQGKALERDGVQILSGGNRTLTPPLKRWAIGSNYNGSSRLWQADLQAIFVFEKILDSQQRLDFFQYIEDEYGVDMP